MHQLSPAPLEVLIAGPVGFWGLPAMYPAASWPVPLAFLWPCAETSVPRVTWPLTLLHTRDNGGKVVVQ